MVSSDLLLTYQVNSYRCQPGKDSVDDYLCPRAIERVQPFHASVPGYRPTPLQRLPALAGCLGLSEVWVKDESQRWGLPAFKVLGGLFAAAMYLSERVGLDASDLSLAAVRSEQERQKLSGLTFVTATDGNHGRSVAWSARQLGHRAVVFVPADTAQARCCSIAAEGAEVVITAGNYDFAVQAARDYARGKGRVLLQDTAWPGYERIPRWIMQGYTTLIREALDQIGAAGLQAPSHVLLQAGVGSFAASLTGYLRAVQQPGPIIAVVEPQAADCFYQSCTAGSDRPQTVTGALATIMAGLACGRPSDLAWPLLRNHADVFVRCSDELAARGMRILANPLPGDPRIIAGESGAVGAGILDAILGPNGLTGARDALQLTGASRVLLISTEGSTDPEMYRDIVWRGRQHL